MKANSLEELVTNSNIAGELRNYTDWHTRLVKFAQLVADWQKERMVEEAVEGEVYLYHSYNRDATAILVDIPKENLGNKVCIVVLKEEE